MNTKTFYTVIGLDLFYYYVIVKGMIWIWQVMPTNINEIFKLLAISLIYNNIYTYFKNYIHIYL